METIIAYAWKLALTGFLTTFMFLILWFVAILILALLAKILAGDDENK